MPRMPRHRDSFQVSSPKRSRCDSPPFKEKYGRSFVGTFNQQKMLRKKGVKNNWSTIGFFCWLRISCEMHLHKFDSFLRAILFIEVCLINPWTDKQSDATGISLISLISLSVPKLTKSKSKKTPPAWSSRSTFWKSSCKHPQQGPWQHCTLDPGAISSQPRIDKAAFQKNPGLASKMRRVFRLELLFHLLRCLKKDPRGDNLTMLKTIDSSRCTGDLLPRISNWKKRMKIMIGMMGSSLLAKQKTRHLGCSRSSSRQWRQRRGWPGKTCNAH